MDILEKKTECCDTKIDFYSQIKTKLCPAQLRVQKELSQLELSHNFQLIIPFPQQFMSFRVIIQPDLGYWKDQAYTFFLTIPESYPYNPPKIRCESKICHPNIDEKGSVCLAELGLEWKPILSLDCILYGLLNLFLEPNCDDPLNKEAALLYLNERHKFQCCDLNAM